MNDATGRSELQSSGQVKVEGGAKAAWLETASTVVALTATVMLGASVMYDAAFFRVMRISLSEVPTSVEDHVRTALVWVPGAVLGTIAVLGMYSCAATVLAAKENADKATVEAHSKKGRVLGIAAALGGVVALLFSWLALSLSTTFLVAYFAWLGVRVGSMTQPSVRDLARGWPAIVKVPLVVVPVAVLWIAADGADDAERMLSSGEARWTIYWREGKDGKAPQEMAVTGLRQFSRFLVAATPDGRAVIFPNESVVRVDHLEAGTPEGALCDQASICISPLASAEKRLRATNAASASRPE